jgi:Tol biopolymer transport system component
MRRSSPQSSAYVADIDIGQRHIREPSRLTFNEGLNVPTAWSADGKSIIFWARQVGRTGIFRQFLHNQTALPLITGSDDYQVPRLGPDPNSVLYFRVLHDSDPNAPVQIMRVPVEGGPAQAVLTTHLMDTVRCAPLANLCGIAERNSDQKQIVFTALDLLKGRGRELARLDVDAKLFYLWDISPDGRRIAVLYPLPGHVVIVPIVGNGPKQEFTIRGWQQLGSFDWAADGKGFFTSSTTTTGTALLHIDLAGDAQVLWEVKGGTSAWAVPSPDGRRLVISAFVINGNIWTIEHL